MGGKRKSIGGGEGPANTRKRRTRKKVSPPNLDMDEPQVEGIVKVGLDPGMDNNQCEMVDDPFNQDLSSNPVIDIGEVKVFRHPAQYEFTLEAEDVSGADSNMTNESQTPNIEPDIGRNVDAAPSTSRSSEWRISDGGKNNETNSNFSSDSNGNPLLNIIAEGSEASTGKEAQDANEDTTSTTIGGQLLSGGPTGVEEAQEMLTRSGSVPNDVSKKSLIGVAEKDVKNMSNMQKKDEDIITRLTAELKAAMDDNELLKRKVDSENIRIEELSNQIKLSEDYAAQCEGLNWLKKELEKARGETETLKRELHTKNVDLDKQTNQATLLGEEKMKLVQENSRTVERLEEELNKKTNLLKISTSVVERRTIEIEDMKKEITKLNTENTRLNNSEQSCENERLQDDNANLRRLITEKDEVIQRTGEIEGWMKILEDDSNVHRAALDELLKQQKEASSEIDLLKNLILEKDNELVRFKAKYLRDHGGNYQLHPAAYKGDEQAVKDLLELGADVNVRNYNGETPIILVASNRGEADATLKIIKLLIEQGADVFATDGVGQTFLHKFISNENPPSSSQFHEILEFLVSKNLTSLFNTRDTDNGTTPFMLAARNVDLDMVTIYLLKKNGVNFSLLDNNGMGCVSYAAEGNRNGGLLPKLIENGKTKHKNLAGAIKGKDEYSLIALVLRGADVNSTNEYFETSLHLAAQSRNTTFSINAIKLLITSGANVNAKDVNGNIFLHEFVDETYRTVNPAKFHDLVSFLISKDLTHLFNTTNHREATPLVYAVEYVKIETATLSLLKDSGFNFNAIEKHNMGWSILHSAIYNGRTSLRLISDLVAFGADPKHLNDRNESMLHVAVDMGRFDLLQFFLNHGVDVNAQEGEGRTPLHFALRNRKRLFDTVQLLLSNGASPDIEDNYDENPRDWLIEDWDKYPDADKIFDCFKQRIRQQRV